MKRNRQTRDNHFLPAWLHYGNWPIFYKVLVGMVGLVVGALASNTIVNSRFLEDRLSRMVGDKVGYMAEAEMTRIAHILDTELVALSGLSVDANIVEVVSQADVKYASGEAMAKSQIEAYDRVWRESSTESALVQQIIDPNRNSITAQLLDFQRALPDYTEILITDRYGALIAATMRPSKYAYSDKHWWTSAYNGGVGAFFVGRPEYDPAFGSMKIRFAIPVYSPEDYTVIGVMSALVEVQVLQIQASAHHVVLTDEQGWIIAGSDPKYIGLFVPENWMMPDYMFREGAIETVDETGTPILLGAGFSTKVNLAHSATNEVLHNLHWRIFVYQPLKEAYAPISHILRLSLLSVLIFVILAVVVANFMARSLVTPIVHLENIARRMAEGDVAARAWVYRQDELGQLSKSLNTLFEHLTGLLDTMEQQVKERTLALEWRSRDLEMVTEIGRKVAEILEADRLIRQVVILVQERFDLYYVRFYLVDEPQQALVLRLGRGKVKIDVSEAQKRIRIGDGLIGACVSQKQWQVARGMEVEQCCALLHETRSMAALPLRSRGRVLGALVLYSRLQTFFDQQRLTVLQSLADQVATSLDNARLYEESQFLLQRAQRAYGEMGRAAWLELLNSISASGRLIYQADESGVHVEKVSASEPWDDMLQQAVRKSRLEGISAIKRSQKNEHTLTLPVMVLGESIGILNVTRSADTGEWQPDEISVLETLVERLGRALESARLYQNTQLRAAREKIIAELAARMRETLDVEVILNVAAKEIGSSLGLQALDIRLEIGDETLSAFPAGMEEDYGES